MHAGDRITSTWRFAGSLAFYQNNDHAEPKMH
jgi:hypothetical protein